MRELLELMFWGWSVYSDFVEEEGGVYEVRGVRGVWGESRYMLEFDKLFLGFGLLF